MVYCQNMSLDKQTSGKTKSCALGCQQNEGRGTAAQPKLETDNTLERFDLSYSNYVASVMDTDSAMNAFGILVKDDPRGNTEWIGCSVMYRRRRQPLCWTMNLRATGNVSALTEL